MYLIVSASENYKSNIKFPDDKIRANTIGHEIHITRPIVLILLSLNLIDKTDTIVTKNKERFCLYSKIFLNIITYDDLSSDIDPALIIDVTHANMWTDTPYDMEKTDFERRFSIMSQIRKYKNVDFRTDIFSNLMKNIEYNDFSELIKKKYIIVHHRLVKYYKEKNYTQEIISKIKKIDPSLQIFIFCNKKLTGYTEDITFIDDISIYASLMNNDNCVAVISEFSGGGQLSQYCHNKKIIYFCGAYDFYPGCNITDVFKEANNANNLYDYFDAKLFTNASVYICSTINTLLNNISSILNDTEKKLLRI